MNQYTTQSIKYKQNGVEHVFSNLKDFLEFSGCCKDCLGRHCIKILKNTEKI